MNKITEKWRQTGLLENIENEIQCDELSIELENMAQRLLKDVPSYNSDSELFAHFANWLLPVVRRVYEDIRPLPSTEWLHNDFKQFYTDKNHVLENFKKNSVHMISAEAEFVSLYIDSIIFINKNNMTHQEKFTYEHWEAQDEYIILHNGPIGYTVSKHDAEIITKWLNVSYPELIARSQPPSNDYILSGGE